MRSLWRKITLPKFESLRRDIKTDVLIIGGGMAGILCAHMLARAGADYVLLEARRICGGITGDTTAKITSQHGLLYADLIDLFGVERARMYLAANEAALAQYRALCKSIDCDFTERDAFTYALYDRRKLEREAAALARIGFPAALADTVPLPFPVAGAVRFPKQAQFHPLRFVSAIADGLNIYENTEVRELRGRTAVTEGGSVSAKRIVVATHFPFLNKHGSYFMKLYQHRSYVLAFAGALDVGGMYVDEAEDGLSFRNQENLLLLGGGAHRTGKKGGGWRELSDAASRYYPGAREVCRWATQDCMTLDGVPYIGRYSKNTDGLYVATGFNKWGMTSAMAAAMLLCDMVQGRENPYADVFSPSRSMLRPQLALNVWEAAASLLTPSVKRCPHMGCALKWNPQERSWDCPCHGSRFEEDGSLIDNPATGDWKQPKKKR
ncbi:MAG: FAD-dependent oxidoreductase [Clostridia bacterium]|nr:FAD-dependent oxidoreductase [Clostridia bacterium]